MSESLSPPAPSAAAERSRKIRRRALTLFCIYLSLYGAFMVLNVLSPASMAHPVVFGVNLAIVFGFGLIVAALVLALAYARFANRMPDGRAPEGDRS